MAKKDLIGKKILKDYIIEEHIGSGGFGEVYKAYQVRGDKKFYAAIKRIFIPNESEYNERLSSMRNDIEATDMYFRELYTEVISEVALMHQLAGKSVNVVAYFQNDIIEHQNPKRYEILIAMEFLTPLSKYISENKMSANDIIQMGIEIADALSICHEKGIMHRDIKEANIFINEDGIYKLGDFGLAKILQEKSKATSNVGSMAYKAPETMNPFGEYNKTVDIYSLGIVLYRLMNYGRIPFLPAYPQKYTSNDENEALKRRFQGEHLPVPSLASKELSDVIIKACSPNPKARYQTAKELKLELQLLQKNITEEELKKIIVVSEDKSKAVNMTKRLKVQGNNRVNERATVLTKSQHIVNSKVIDKKLGKQAKHVGTVEAENEYINSQHHEKMYISEDNIFSQELGGKEKSEAEVREQIGIEDNIVELKSKEEKADGDIKNIPFRKNKLIVAFSAILIVLCFAIVLTIYNGNNQTKKTIAEKTKNTESISTTTNENNSESTVLVNKKEAARKAAVEEVAARKASAEEASKLEFEIEFQDSNFEILIRNEIGKRTGKLLASDVIEVTELNSAKYDYNSEKEIKDLEGIQIMTNLKYLRLYNEGLRDIDEIGSLYNLEEVSVSIDNECDLSVLSSLSKLKILEIQSDINNTIPTLNNLELLNLSIDYDLDLSNLGQFTNLKHFSLYAYGSVPKVCDFSQLSGMDNVEHIFISDFIIDDLSYVRNLNKLKTITFSYCKISKNAQVILNELQYNGVDVKRYNDV